MDFINSFYDDELFFVPIFSEKMLRKPDFNAAQVPGAVPWKGRLRKPVGFSDERCIRMEEILNRYYADNAKKLHMVVDKILLRFGGLADKDTDDFYSLANEVFADALKRYDNLQSFDGFLYSCLLNKIKTEITKRNREKRKADRMSVSMDAPLCDDEDSTLGDMIAGSFDVEKEIFKRNEEEYSKKMLLYLSRLSSLQKEVLRLATTGYVPKEIKEELHISEKQYTDCNAAIHSYRNISVLF